MEHLKKNQIQMEQVTGQKNKEEEILKRTNLALLIFLAVSLTSNAYLFNKDREEFKDILKSINYSENELGDLNTLMTKTIGYYMMVENGLGNEELLDKFHSYLSDDMKSKYSKEVYIAPDIFSGDGVNEPSEFDVVEYSIQPTVDGYKAMYIIKYSEFNKRFLLDLKTNNDKKVTNIRCEEYL